MNLNLRQKWTPYYPLCIELIHTVTYRATGQLQASCAGVHPRLLTPGWKRNQGGQFQGQRGQEEEGKTLANRCREPSNTLSSVTLWQNTCHPSKTTTQFGPLAYQPKARCSNPPLASRCDHAIIFLLVEYQPKGQMSLWD